MVSSGIGGEGTSTLVCNLGAAAAQARRRVLLIDLNLRSPALERILGIDGRFTVAEVLRGTVSPEAAVLNLTIPSPVVDDRHGSGNGRAGNLDVMTAGAVTDGAAQLLAGGKLAELLDYGRNNADLILIDAPPILATSDSALILPSMDAVVLVVNSGTPTRTDLDRVRGVVFGTGMPILGYILNRVRSSFETAPPVLIHPAWTDVLSRAGQTTPRSAPK